MLHHHVGQTFVRHGVDCTSHTLLHGTYGSFYLGDVLTSRAYVYCCWEQVVFEVCKLVVAMIVGDFETSVLVFVDDLV